jgi:hypothetical protein
LLIGEGVLGGGGGDADSYCDSEASLDDGSCYDNLEEPLGSPPPDVGVVHQSLDLRHAHHEVRLRLYCTPVKM